MIHRISGLAQNVAHSFHLKDEKGNVIRRGVKSEKCGLSNHGSILFAIQDIAFKMLIYYISQLPVVLFQLLPVFAPLIFTSLTFSWEGYLSRTKAISCYDVFVYSKKNCTFFYSAPQSARRTNGIVHGASGAGGFVATQGR